MLSRGRQFSEALGFAIAQCGVPTGERIRYNAAMREIKSLTEASWLPCICLPKDYELRFILTAKIMPAMLRPVVDVDVLLKAITINNVLRLQVPLWIDRLSVTQSKRIIVQWPT